MTIDNLKVFMGRPILVSEEHNIYAHQPLIHDIVDIGEDTFNKYILPYTLTTDAVFDGAENSDELISQFHILDLFFINISEDKRILDKVFSGNAIDTLRESLAFFLKSDDIRILENRKKIIINNSYLIDQKEFDRLRDVIQKVVGRGDIEFEKTPKDMTPRKKKIWQKLQEGRRRTAERNSIYLQDIINYVSFGGNSYIPTKQIDEMTYFYLQNAYKSIVGMDSYKTGMQYKLSQKYDVKDEIKHWTETLKIGK